MVLLSLTLFFFVLAGHRAFLTRTYPTMKKHNPSTPIMLRDAQGTLPKVYARYDLGKEKSQSLEGTYVWHWIERGQVKNQETNSP